VRSILFLRLYIVANYNLQHEKVYLLQDAVFYDFKKSLLSFVKRKMKKLKQKPFNYYKAKSHPIPDGFLDIADLFTDTILFQKLSWC
jgi:hypothetical protein